MRVFLTGATGFIASAVSRELISAGHQVIGLTRSNQGAEALKAAGVEPHSGHLEDLDSLRSGASRADAVIHCAFIHDAFVDGGFEKFRQVCEIDKQAIQALGSVLAGSDRPLLVSSGIPLLFQPGVVITEDMDWAADSPMPRVSEQAALAMIPQGVRAIVIRLPQVHDTVKQGLVTFLIAIARQKGVSAYVADGGNHWPAGHVLDTARLYRLALEKNVVGARYHAVGEEGVSVREMAEAIGRGLKVPVVSIPQEQASEHFGFLGMFAGMDMLASSALTQERLGWRPTGVGMIADLQQMRYFEN